MTEASWQAMAVLVDPVRRSLYEHVRRQQHPVSREEAADALAISRNLSAFHLDKLVEAGLLRARYEAPADQPRGRGRTPKVYEPADDGLSLSVPPRQYELIGEILADAVATAPNDAQAAAQRRAVEVGREVAMTSGTKIKTHSDVRAQTTATFELLRDLGFDPVADDTGITLQNCPFHRLAERQTELVCGLNEAFIHGLLDGLDATRLGARLAPQPGACCVRVGEALGASEKS